MKNRYSLSSLVLLLSCFSAAAQQVNVSYLNPMIGDGSYKYFRFGNSNAFYGGLMWNNNDPYWGDGDDLVLLTFEDRDINLHPQGGNVNVLSGLSVKGANPMPGTNNFRNFIQLNSADHAAIVYNPGESTEMMFGFHSNGRFYWGNDLSYAMTLTKTGSAVIYNSLSIGGGGGISGYTLSVNGKAAAREVRVTLDGWSDHVFKDDYSLLSLEKLAAYIGSHRHLPGIPTEQEVKRDGIHLGEMNAKLLEKIEELTLYLIEQNRVNKEQKKLIEQQQTAINRLEALIEVDTVVKGAKK